MFSFNSISKDLEAVLYAAHVRGILLYHITVLQKAVSYGALAKATGSLPSGGQLAQALARIAEHDHSAGKPISTAIVVREDTGIPGAGFFNQCRKLGYDIIEDPAEEWNFWRKILGQLDVDIISEPDPISGLLHRPISSKEEISVLSSLWKIPEIDGSVDDLDEVFPRPSESRVEEETKDPSVKAGDRVKGTTQVVEVGTASTEPKKEGTKVPKRVLLPVTQLAKGDVVWLSGHPSSMLVDEVFSEVLTPGMIRWKNTEGQVFETPVNSHLKVDLPPRLGKAWSKTPGSVTPIGGTVRVD